jgi:hypothetical protein
MGICSHALFHCLLEDLSTVLPRHRYDALVERRGRLRYPGISSREVASLALLDSSFKKYGEQSTEADKAALEKFLEANAKCERFSWPDILNLPELDTLALGESKKAIHDFFFDDSGDYWISTDKILKRMLPGPGASILATGDSFYHKIGMSPLSTTSRALFELYRSEISKYDLWLETEKIRSSHHGDFTEVRGSRLSFVPKNSEISRTICTEPLLNMLVQKGIGSLLESSLRRTFSIDLSYQADKNRELARIGSLTGQFGTIDLSSASDTISLKMLRDVVPRLPYAWFNLARSSITTLPNGEEVPLHMVSSMGNAFTFPLQTILFSCIVVGCYRALGIPVRYGRGPLLNPKRKKWKDLTALGNFSVFGDDIIVDRRAYDLVMRLLGYFGFIPNHEKSYAEGPFRESCGSDFWNGDDVRGVYITSLKSKQDIYSAINRLNVWSANHDIPLPRSVGYLVDQVKFIPVPTWETDDSGIKVPLWLAGPQRKDKRTGSILYSRYVPRTKGISLLNVDAYTRIPRGKFHNPPGVLLSAIAGYVRDGSVVERQRLVSYTRRFAISPSWDWYDAAHSSLTSAGWRRWVTSTVWLHLGKT